VVSLGQVSADLLLKLLVTEPVFGLAAEAFLVRLLGLLSVGRVAGQFGLSCEILDGF